MTLPVAALVLLGSVSVAIAGMYLVRRRAPAGGFYTDVDRAGAIFGVVGTAFAVLLAFVIFVAFQSYDSARSKASARGRRSSEALFHDAFPVTADKRRVAGSADLLQPGCDPPGMARDEAATK